VLLCPASDADGLKASNNPHAVITNKGDTVNTNARTRLIWNHRLFIDPAPFASNAAQTQNACGHSELLCGFVTRGKVSTGSKNKFQKRGKISMPENVDAKHHVVTTKHHATTSEQPHKNTC